MILPEVLARKCKNENIPLDEYVTGCERECKDEIRMVLELCEALSCKNIKPAIHQEASPANVKRIKAGKVPILETKVLTIDVNYGKVTVATDRTIQGRKSPVKHLRMGHTRRLKSGVKIWINNMVVSSGEFRDKIYRVKKDKDNLDEKL